MKPSTDLAADAVVLSRRSDLRRPGRAVRADSASTSAADGCWCWRCCLRCPALWLGGQLAVATSARRRGLRVRLRFNLIPHALAPLAALFYAAGIIQDEVEEQTLTYLLLRPLPRWALYLSAAGDSAADRGDDRGVHRGHLRRHRPDGAQPLDLRGCDSG